MTHPSIYGRFFQAGYVVRNIDAASAALVARTGAKQMDIFRDLRDGEGNEVALRHVAHFHVPGLEFELIEPRLDWPSLYIDALPDAPDDIGFHHLGYMLPDSRGWDEAVESFETFGTPIVMQGATPVVRFAYVDTRRQTGHYSEIVQRFTVEGQRPMP